MATRTATAWGGPVIAEAVLDVVLRSPELVADHGWYLLTARCVCRSWRRAVDRNVCVLESSRPSPAEMHSISRAFTSLRSLTLVGVDRELAGALSVIVTQLSGLTTLSLTWKRRPHPSDQLWAALSHCARLVSLELSCATPPSRGTAVANPLPPSLLCLTLYACAEWPSNVLLTILDGAQQLTSLTLMPAAAQVLAGGACAGVPHSAVLQQLSLRHSSLSDAHLSQLAALPNLPQTLTALDLQDHRLSTDAGIAKLRAFSSLTQLDLSANPQMRTAGYAALAPLAPTLTWLSITDSGPYGWRDEVYAALEALTGLTYLAAGNMWNEVLRERDDFRSLAVLRKLESLDLNHCIGQLHPHPLTALGTLHRLTSLDIGAWPHLDFADLSALQPLTQLRELVASSGAPGVGAAELGPEPLRFLHGMRNLQRLSLSHWGLGQVNAGEFSAAIRQLPALTALSMRGARLNTAALEAVGQLPCLTELDVGDNVLHGAGCVVLGGLTGVTSLTAGPFQHMQVPPEFTYLGQLRHLRRLQLLTDCASRVASEALLLPAVDTLRRLTGLEELAVTDKGCERVELLDVAGFVDLQRALVRFRRRLLQLSVQG